MNTSLAACLLAATVSGVASASITNGDFSNGSTGWTQFGGSEGPYAVGSSFGFDNDSDAVVAYGTFGGTPNFSGFAQDIAGGYAEGDTINFGGQMYIENGKELFGGNNANIQLTFWYGSGSDFGFAVVAGTLDASSLTDNVYTFASSYTLDAGAASATRISLDFTYVQTDVPQNGEESGAAWATNMYANVVPAPGALALIGCAGFRIRRRRD